MDGRSATNHTLSASLDDAWMRWHASVVVRSQVVRGVVAVVHKSAGGSVACCPRPCIHPPLQGLRVSYPHSHSRPLSYLVVFTRRISESSFLVFVWLVGLSLRPIPSIPSYHVIDPRELQLPRGPSVPRLQSRLFMLHVWHHLGLQDLFYRADARTRQ